MVYRSPHAEHDNGDLTTGTRVCLECGERKDMSAFGWTSGKRYRQRRCTKCYVARGKARRDANPELYRERGFVANIRSYGITVGQYDEMLAVQDNRCAICREEFAGRPHIDHDHKTRRVRGLLCFTCNTALGKFHDSVDLLRRAIEYLLRSDEV